MPPRLTFGVELEFALATLHDQCDPDPEDRRPVYGFSLENAKCFDTWGWPSQHQIIMAIIAHTLSQAGVRARCYDLSDEGDWNQPWEKYDVQWLVDTDGSVKGPNEKYEWKAIEVGSPPYIFSPESLQAVRLVCHVLTSEFRINVNESTGLHVHVGNGADGFAFKTIRNLMAFLWVFEPQLDKLHPNRLNGNFYLSLRKSSRMAIDMKWVISPPLSPIDEEEGNGIPFRSPTEVSRNLAVLDGLNKIFAVLNINELIDLIDSQCGKSAYYLGYLKEPFGNPTKRTIEFRQHEGTLDGEQVAAWIETVIGLVEFADGCDTEAVLEFVTEHARLEDNGEATYDVVDLLRDIGLEEPAEFWGQWLEKRKPPPGQKGGEERVQRLQRWYPENPVEFEGLSQALRAVSAEDFKAGLQKEYLAPSEEPSQGLDAGAWAAQLPEEWQTQKTEKAQARNREQWLAVGGETSCPPNEHEERPLSRWELPALLEGQKPPTTLAEMQVLIGEAWTALKASCGEAPQAPNDEASQPPTEKGRQAPSGEASRPPNGVEHKCEMSREPANQDGFQTQYLGSSILR